MTLTARETNSSIEAGEKEGTRARIISAGAGALFALFAVLLGGAAHAQMDDIDRARRMHDRLAGVPPDDTTLTTMAGHITGGRPDLAAEIAMQNPNFYNVVLKNWITPCSRSAARRPRTPRSSTA